ncbi:MAG: hypothetical protein K2Q06_00410 [Parvularculaceae bacterium]|nr:hypothetical protein [Parvularculaceae bacterium]
MSVAKAEIDWTRASEDRGLIEACRAAAAVAAEFEQSRTRERRRASFADLFRRLHVAARRNAVR